MSFVDSLQGIGKFGVGPFGLPDLASVGGVGKMMGPGNPAGLGGLLQGSGGPGQSAAVNGGKLALQLAMMAAMGG